MPKEVTMPEQVVEQERQAEELVKAALPAVETPAPEPTETPVETPEPQVEPTPEPMPEPAAPSELDELKEQMRALEAKFKTLQGKYQAEVPAAAARVRELTVENQTLRQVLAEQPKPTAPVATPSDAPTLAKLREVLGDEPVNEIAELLRQHTEETKRAQAELQQRVTSVDESTKQVKQNTFLSQLSALVPDWEKYNDDPGLLQWLSETDPLTGVIRHTMLRQAADAFDAQRAAAFFNTFKATLAPPVSAGKVPVRTPSLASQQAPKKAASAATPAPAPAGRVYTAAEYQAEATNVTRLMRTDKQAALALQQELDRALAERRVTR